MKVVALENVSFSDTQNPKQLPQKHRSFSQCFFAFLKSILNFQHFQKKDDSHI